jgi:hypothetical protein
MDTRRLVLGLSLLLVVAGVLVACFAPGGLWNRQSVTQSVDVPFMGNLTVRSEGAPSSWLAVVGWVLAGAGAVGMVAAFAMRPAPRP